jgi:NADH-quinone oxidoreductase subunit G
LTKTESIDVMDALGSNIRVDTKGREVMRFLPRNHDGVNEEWISDKTRFVWDGLRRQRLDTPYIRENGKLRKAGWDEALKTAAAAMAGKKVVGLVGDLASTEAAYSLKALVESTGGVVECRVDNSKLPSRNRSGYVGNAAIEDIDNAQMILLIGTNPAIESPVLNARIRKAWLNGAKVAVVGEAIDLSYDYQHIGTDREALAALAKMDHSDKDGVRGVMIVGQGALTEADGDAVLGTAMQMAEAGSSKFMVLHTAAGRVGAMDVDATNADGMKAVEGADVVYNMGADEIEIDAGPFVIYQGSHGDRGAHRADIILPGAAYTEENGLFVNTEGRPQLAMRASFAPGEAKENWAILRALSAEMAAQLPWDSLAGLRTAMIAAVPHLAKVDEVADNEWQPTKAGKLGKATFKTAVKDFYLTNPIARASQLMGELSGNAKKRAEAPIAAE